MGWEQVRCDGARGHIPGKPKHSWREEGCFRFTSLFLIRVEPGSGHSPAPGRGIRALLTYPHQSKPCLTSVPIPGALLRPYRLLSSLSLPPEDLG